MLIKVTLADEKTVIMIDHYKWCETHKSVKIYATSPISVQGYTCFKCLEEFKAARNAEKTDK